MEIGCGGGHLGFALMKITNLDLIFLDNNKNALDIAQKRSENFKVQYRTSDILADVQDMPLEDESINLVISRGSLWFWEDKKKSLGEIYRVLKEDGVAYIGCGFGNEQTQNQVYEKMKEIDGDNWAERRKKFTDGNDAEVYNDILNKMDIKNFKIKDDEEGFWIIIKKG